MLQTCHTLFRTVEHCVLELRLGLLIPPQKVKDPSVGVQVCRVVRLFLDCLPAHRAGFLQFAALERKVVGVIVKGRGIVRIDFQNLSVDLESFLLVPKLVVHVPDRGQGGDRHGGVALGYLDDSLVVVNDSLPILPVVAGDVLHVQKRGLLRKSH